MSRVEGTRVYGTSISIKGVADEAPKALCANLRSRRKNHPGRAQCQPAVP